MGDYVYAAAEILRESGRSLHYKKITEQAIEKHLIKSSGKTPDQSMYSAIIKDIKSKGTSSKFITLGKGKFSLNSDI